MALDHGGRRAGPQLRRVHGGSTVRCTRRVESAADLADGDLAAQRLDDVVKAVERPAVRRHRLRAADALGAENSVPVDVFWSTRTARPGRASIHPVQALRAYRDKMGIGAKLVVVGMVSNGFSIADPDDARHARRRRLRHRNAVGHRRLRNPDVERRMIAPCPHNRGARARSPARGRLSLVRRMNGSGPQPHETPEAPAAPEVCRRSSSPNSCCDHAGGWRLAAAGVGGQRVGELGGGLEALGRLEGQRLLQDRRRRIGQLADAVQIVAA